MSGRVFIGIGLTIIAIGIALPYIVFNTESKDMGEAFGSVIIGIAIMFGVTPILVVAGVVMIVIGVVRLVKDRPTG